MFSHTAIVIVYLSKCIPYLITMSTDSETSVRLKAEHLMNEIDSKYGYAGRALFWLVNWLIELIINNCPYRHNFKLV